MSRAWPSTRLEARHPRAGWFAALGVALVLAAVTGVVLVLTGLVAPEYMTLVFAAVTLVALVPLRGLLNWRERRARAVLDREARRN